MHHIARCYARAQLGLQAPLVSVETHISSGLPRFNLVGLAETAVRESKERVRSAIMSAHFAFPDQRITVNLAPADLPKEGARFDLAIALSILAASNQLPQSALLNYEFLAELTLLGELRPIKSLLASARQTVLAQKYLIIAKDNLPKARLCQGLTVFGADHLLEVYEHLIHKKMLPPCPISTLDIPVKNTAALSEVQGQAHAKRALTIAAAGGHNVLMQGPPGSGKSLLAERFQSLLPPLSAEQALEVASIHDLNHSPRPLSEWLTPPFKSPHHTSSAVALVGGGQKAKPGQISLAHLGVLFLDELTEFKRETLEALREPLETGYMHIARANYDITLPARFQFIAAMNPCPCGNLNHPQQNCRCTPDQVRRYRAKLSQPLLDRIDLHLDIPWFSPEEISADPNDNATKQTDDQYQTEVSICQKQQFSRQGVLNAHLASQQLKTWCELKTQDLAQLQRATKRFALSIRTQHRLLKVARTIADLEESVTVEQTHLLEALSYRCRLFDSYRPCD